MFERIFERLPNEAVSLVVGIVISGVVAVGALKSLFEVLSGQSLSLQEAAYFIGTAAISIGVGGFAGGVLMGSIIVVAIQFLSKPFPLGERGRGVVEGAAVCLGCACFVGYVAVAVWGFYVGGNDLLYTRDYDLRPGAFRGWVALIGVVTVGAALYYWRQMSKRIAAKRKSKKASEGESN